MAATKQKIQRNDPCPCGSGKKYKHCCLGTQGLGKSQAPVAMMQVPDVSSADKPAEAMYEAHYQLMIDLLEFVRKNFKREVTDIAWAEFTRFSDRELDPDDSETIDFFYPWMLFYWRPELEASFVRGVGLDMRALGELAYVDGCDVDGVDPINEDPANVAVAKQDDPIYIFPPIADMYLTVADGRLKSDIRYLPKEVSALKRRIIAAACDTPFSFYRIEQMVGTSHVRLRDLIEPADIVVCAPNFFDRVAIGSVMYAQILTIDDASIVAGTGSCALDEKYVEPLSRIREKLFEALPNRGDKWRQYADDELRGLYFELCNQDYDVLGSESAATGEAGDSEFDAPLLTTVKYTLAGTLEEHVQALAHLSMNTADELLCSSEVVIDDDGEEVEEVQILWFDPEEKCGDQRGEIRIRPDGLTAYLIGSGRQAEFEAEIQARFGQRAKLVDVNVLTVGEMTQQLAKQRATERLQDKQRNGGRSSKRNQRRKR